jgi:hypothetical protein
LVSFSFITLLLVGCELGSSSDDPCYDGSYYDCHGYPYDNGGGSSGSGGYTYDSGTTSPSSSDSPSTSCIDSFVVAFPAPDASGDCKLTLASDAYDTIPIAIYYLGVPDAGESLACETLEGPTFGRCVRELDLVTLASTNDAQMRALRTLIGSATTFSATLSCAHSVSEPTKTVTITCTDPAGPHAPADASVGDSAGGDAGCNTP